MTITKAKWVSGIVMLLVITLLVTVSKAYANDYHQATQSRHYNKAILYIPKGARVLEIIETRLRQAFYVRYVFRHSCYMAYVGHKKFALTYEPCG